jgi:clan AA aspartic protease (TIGR02281 family)
MKISLNKEDPIILIRAELIGKVGWYEIEMALDTGATYTMIPWSVAERLGYDPATSVERVALTTVSTIEKAPLITLKSIRVSDIGIDNVKVAVHDLPPKSRVDGLLGLSFLKHFDTNLHFKRKTLEINDP